MRGVWEGVRKEGRREAGREGCGGGEMWEGGEMRGGRRKKKKEGGGVGRRREERRKGEEGGGKGRRGRRDGRS